MDQAELVTLLRATGEEIKDENGQVLGFVCQPAKFKLDRPTLALGGFLVVTRTEETGEYVGTLFDGLPHPKTGRPYPAGHSEVIWRTHSLHEAVRFVQEELTSSAGEVGR